MSVAMIPTKISRSHLDRVALVYVRQSSLAQVRDHTESTARQYALAEQATALGWAPGSVQVIDADLGVSGRSTEGRDGFRYLISRVCLGEVGAVFGLEVSRLARSTADLTRLLELARLTDTLLIDGDGVYDLTDFNDRLLLGLKGTMSEAELHLLAGRLHGAKKAAAARGELRCPLPVGYVRDADDRIVIDPDEQVAAAVADVFAFFQRTGSAFGVVKAFSGRTFPLRAYGGVWAGQLRWGLLTHARVLGVLNNPCYAGAYVYGRYRSVRRVDPDGGIHSGIRLQSMDDWQVVIEEHHPGYIGWAEYLANRARLTANRTVTGARPPREGTALCQGIIGCGSCGHQMTVRYLRDGHGFYECHSLIDGRATGTCRSISAGTIDAAVVNRLLTALTPAEIELAFTAADRVAYDRGRLSKAAELAVERARYEADRAERAFTAAEPENRLVTRTLESRWEVKLTALADAEAALTATRNELPPLPARADLEALISNLPALFDAESTTPRDRKRLLRTLIADVTLLPETDKGTARIGISWHTGAAEEITTARHVHPGTAKKTPTAAAELICRIGPSTSNPDLVAALNAAGHRTGTGRPFDIKAVQWARRVLDVPTPGPLRPGEISVADAATRLDVSADAVYHWISTNDLTVRRGPGNRIAIPWTPETEKACRQRISQSHHLKTVTREDTHDQRA